MSNHSHYPDPWDRDSYETGSTKPPKSRGGILMLLLIAVIFLGGITGSLGILNIRLFSQLQNQTEPTTPAYFYDSNSGNLTDATHATDGSQDPVELPTGDVSLELEKAPESLENIPQTGGLSLQEIYEKNIPSVASISCTLGGGTSSGTGVVLSSDGFIVTNAHVVSGARSIRVLLTDGRTFDARIVGTDALSDLAVLYIEADDLTPAAFGDASTARVGDAVVAIGDPLGVELRGTMTDGIISAINRDITVSGRKMSLLQTNAALNSGNSGGPLINCYGQVIGINTLKIGAFVDSAGVEGLGFAIPSTTVKEVVDQLISQGYVSGRPTLGFTGEEVSSAYQHFYNIPQGLFITSVTPGSAAQELGIAKGDVLISLNGHRITGPEDLNSLLYSLKVGEQAELVIYRHRNHKQYTLTMTLQEAKG